MVSSLPYPALPRHAPAPPCPALPCPALPCLPPSRGGEGCRHVCPFLCFVRTQAMEADSSKSGDVPFLGDVVEPVPSAAPPAAPRPQGYYRTLVLLCMVGFFWNCKPSEPYLTRYLLTDKNLTEAQLDHEVWPWYTYGKFLFLLPVGIIAESLGVPAPELTTAEMPGSAALC